MSRWTMLLISLVIASPIYTLQNKPYEGHKVLRIRTENVGQMQILNNIEEWTNDTVDFWRMPRRVGDFADLSIHSFNQNGIVQFLQQNNFSYMVTIDNLQNVLEKELHERDEREMFMCGNDAATIDTEAYHSFDEIECYLAAVNSKYSASTQIIHIGKSFEKRNLTVIKIGEGNSKAMAAFLNGGIHGREWLTVATTVYIINELTENADRYRHILDKMDIYVMPVLNPDGYSYTWTTNRMWRKTRSGPHNGCYGVDLNRNWDFKWLASGSSSFSCSFVYAGPSAFSEPESRYLAEFLSANNETIRAYFDIHAYGEFMMFPYGYAPVLPENYILLNETAALATKIMNSVNGANFRHGSIVEILYPASGSTIDYTKGVLNIDYTYAIELRPGDGSTAGFLLPADQIHAGASEAWAGILIVLNNIA